VPPVSPQTLLFLGRRYPYLLRARKVAYAGPRPATDPFLRDFALINDAGTGTTTNGSVTIPATAVDGDVVIVHHHARCRGR
jgi:hypothetical protein